MTARLTIVLGLVLAATCLGSPTALAGSGGYPPPQGTGFDGRSPDTTSAATHTSTGATVVVVDATGFDWTDAGLGGAAGVGTGLVLLAAFGLTRSRNDVLTSS